MEIQVLGPLRVILDGGTVRLGPPLQQKVLAALLVRRNEIVPRRTLIADVWSDDAAVFDAWELDERKRAVLHTYIARLRAALAPAARAAGQGAVIVTEGTGYRLVLDEKYLDETQFKDLVTQGHDALTAGRPAVAVQRLDLALSLWRGDPLGDLHGEEFAHATVTRLVGLRLAALEAKTDAHLLLGRHRDLVADAGLRRWVEEYPSSEHLHHALAVALHRSGQTAAAVTACRDGIAILAGSGVPPAALHVLLDELSASDDRSPPDAEATAAHPDPLDAAAEALSRVVRRQWRAEIALRQLPDPHPIPVRWRPSGPDGGDVLRTDEIGAVLAAFQSLRRRRLVVLGPAGSGKSTLAILLTVELAGRRRPADPVPVLLSLSSWQAGEEHLYAWLRRRLAEEYPVLLDAGRFGATAIHDLLADRRILPVLDGLDELPPPRRSAALRAINRTLVAEDSLVLTSRPAEYRDAAEGLSGATVVEALPVRTGDALDYLRHSMSSEAGWSPVFAELTDRPDGPLAVALTSPLSLMLTRLVYAGARDPAELADAVRFPDRPAIEGHLLDMLVPALVEQDAHRDAPARLRSWDPGAFRGWLVFLARRAQRQETYDIAWWRLPEAVRPLAGRVGRAVVAGAAILLVAMVLAGARDVSDGDIMSALADSLKHGLAYGLGTLAAGLCIEPPPPPGTSGTRRQVLVNALRTGLAGGGALGLVQGIGEGIGRGPSSGIIAGIAYALGMGTAFGLVAVIAAVPSPTAADFRLRGRGTALLRMLGWGLAAGTTVGLAAGAVGQLALTIVRRRGLPYDEELVIGLLPGLAFGVVVGVASALIHWSRRPIATEEALDLRRTLAADRRQYLVLLAMVVTTIVVAFTLGSLLYLDTGFGSTLRHGVGVGLTASIALALAFSFTAAWPRYQMARFWLAARRRLPWRFATFLEEAQRIGVLRRLGATYQFRHASLQDRLVSGSSRDGDRHRGGG